MILPLHIAIALASVVLTTVLYFRPSHAKLHVAYSLVAATLASGTYLVVSTHASIVHACFSGVFYLVVVSTGIALSTRKLSYVRSKNHNH